MPLCIMKLVLDILIISRYNTNIMIRTKNLESILRNLNYQIKVNKGSPINLVVCGGTALLALGFIKRVTKDIDVLGVYSSETGVQKIKKFPEWLTKAAKKVARDYGLPQGWLNLGPAAQLETGLPDGLDKRLIAKCYGEYLTIYYISRIDQIFFKLYAAVDRNDYHVEDLFALEPTTEELEKAIRWVLSQDVSLEFRLLLKNFLEKNAYEDIAEKI